MAPEETSFSQEVGAGLAQDALPAYAPMLAAFHRACAAPLREIVGSLPLQPGDRVLDMACGDGVYSVWLADQVGPSGSVTGVDIAPAYLDLARGRARRSSLSAIIGFEVGDIAALPFPDDSFDLVWCAHSLYSLPDPIAALRELRRVVRRGGTVAILENDTLHHMLLPWPAELELAVRQAQLDALQAETARAGKFYIGRNLCHAFKIADLGACAVSTHTIDHGAPLSDDERIYFGSYLRDLGERALPHLDPDTRKACEMLLDPRSELYLLDQPDFFASHLEILAVGRK